MEEELKEKLFNKKKVGWENLDTRRKEEIFNFCKDYMDFLNKAKTEREFVKEAKKIADIKWFQRYYLNMNTLNAGDRVYFINRE